MLVEYVWALMYTLAKPAGGETVPKGQQKKAAARSFRLFSGFYWACFVAVCTHLERVVVLLVGNPNVGDERGAVTVAYAPATHMGTYAHQGQREASN